MKLPVLMDDEIDNAITALHNNKSGGEDHVFAEILKYGPDQLRRVLRNFTRIIWDRGKMPTQFSRLQFVPIFKGKGSEAEPNNYRGISLVAVVSKIISNVILKRLQPHLDTTLLDEQCGFRGGRGIMDQIYSVQSIMRKTKNRKIPVYMAFVDIQKAYDSVDRKLLFKILRQYGVHEHICQLIEALYVNVTGFVENPEAVFTLETGVKQGCLLSPTLFNVYMDAIMRVWKTKLRPDDGINVEGDSVTGLLYADDLVIFSTSIEACQRTLTAWHETAAMFGLKTSTEKTKVMRTDEVRTEAKPTDMEITLTTATGIEKIETVDTFKYLGFMLRSDGSYQDDVHRRCTAAIASFNDQKAYLTKDRIPLQQRVAMFNVQVVSALFFGAESWVLTDEQTRRLRTTYHSLLRRTARVYWYMKVSTEQLHAITHTPTFERIAASRTLRWYGHLTRMDPTRLCKKIHQWDLRPAEPYIKEVNRAAEVATTWFPHRRVPPWRQIVEDRPLWTEFTSSRDDGLAWDIRRIVHYAQFGKGRALPASRRRDAPLQMVH
jgi:Reverse transcriptase (RNA-dependent DNA polymerase)